VKSDPFAPPTSPTHPKNLAAETVARRADLAEREQEARRALHTTDHERRFDKLPDGDELSRRATLVEEFDEELSAAGEASNPTLVDMVGEEYVWQAAETAGGAGRWAHAGNADDEPADDEPAEGEAPAATKAETGKRRGGKAKRATKPAEKLADALAALDEPQK